MEPGLDNWRFMMTMYRAAVSGALVLTTERLGRIVGVSGLHADTNTILATKNPRNAWYVLTPNPRCKPRTTQTSRKRIPYDRKLPRQGYSLNTGSHAANALGKEIRGDVPPKLICSASVNAPSRLEPITFARHGN